MQNRLSIAVLSGISTGDVFRFLLEPENKIIIGRDPRCDLVLQDGTVSRRHISLERRDDNYFITDLGSSHGTVHMGFRLKPGKDGRRLLKEGDEFKVGEAIFRVSLPKAAAAETSSISGKPVQGRTLSPFLKTVFYQGQRGKRPIIFALVFVSMLLLLFLGQKASKLPNQLSEQVLILPETRLIGYWPGSPGTPESRKDSRHLAKAQFMLPASDVVVEYDYLSEAEIEVYVDSQYITALAPSPDAWSRHQLIIRDAATGKPRRLIYKNKTFRSAAADLSQPIKRWAVKNVRSSPITQEVDKSFDALLNESLALTARINTSPDALFFAVRSLQNCLAEALRETQLDAVGFQVEVEPDAAQGNLETARITRELQAIIKERASSAFDLQASQRHLDALTRLAGGLDGELWRRTSSRIMRAIYAGRAGNHIAAYDNLLAAQSLFPEGADYRWTRANELFENEELIPMQVRLKPEKFRTGEKVL